MKLYGYTIRIFPTADHRQYFTPSFSVDANGICKAKSKKEARKIIKNYYITINENTFYIRYINIFEETHNPIETDCIENI